jgi:hypothetical protein
MAPPVCLPAVVRPACPAADPVEHSVLWVFPPAVPQALKVFHPAAHRVRRVFRLAALPEITAAFQGFSLAEFQGKSVGLRVAISAGFPEETSEFPVAISV